MSSNLLGRSKALASTTKLISHRLNDSTSACMKGKHLLTLKEFDRPQIEKLLWSAIDMKKIVKSNRSSISFQLQNVLSGRSLAAIFQKRSTRTRMSFEAGAHHLGAHTVFCNQNDIHLGVSESIRDSSLVLSRLVDAVTARVYEHSLLDELSHYSKIPIINALSDLHHPMQALADLMTIYEHFGSLKGIKIAWIGDGNNVLSSLLIAAAKMDMEIAASIPNGYIDCQESINYAKQYTKVLITQKPEEAVKNASVIVTDTWISMGQEKEKLKRLQDFKGYQITLKMLEKSPKNDWIFLHCLPRKLEEVDDEVFYHDKSLVINEAENRKWTTMAVLANLISGYRPRLVKKSPTF